MKLKCIKLNAIVHLFLPTFALCNGFIFDTSFNNPTGYTYINTGVTNTNPYSLSYGIAIQTTQKIVIVGGVNAINPLNSTTQRAGTIASFTPLGYIDTSFNGIGYNNAFIGSSTEFRAVATQLNEKIVVAGYSNSNILIARYLSNGSLDTSFNTTGYIISDAGIANSIALQADGKIIVLATSNNIIKVYRYNADGSLDLSFGTSGKISVIAGSASAIKLNYDGTIIGVGTSSNGSVIFKLTSTGSLDLTFGTNGISQLFLGYLINAKALTLELTDKIIVGASYTATSTSSTNAAMIIAYNLDGSLDESFNQTGYVITQISSYSISSSNSILIAPDQEDSSNSTILYIGSYSNNTTIIISYNTDGSLNTSFTPTGYQTIKLESGSISNGAVWKNDTLILGSKLYKDKIDNLLIMRLFETRSEPKSASSVVIYGQSPLIFSNFLYHTFYAQIISNINARNATIQAINEIIANYQENYKNQSDFNYIAYYHLISGDLLTAQTELIRLYPQSHKEINQFFILLLKRFVTLNN